MYVNITYYIDTYIAYVQTKEQTCMVKDLGN